MIVDLIQVMTRDGVRLDGMLEGASAERSRELAIDACLFVHGTGGSFYSSTLFDGFAERFWDLGVAVLRVNTRGHDLISTAVTSQGGRRLGAAYEVVDDCRHDLAAWLDWLAGRGFSRIGLVGHSLGAVKAIYATALEPHASVAGLVALSPPRLSHAHFCASAGGAEFQATYARAEELVRGGQSSTLMDVRLPLPFVATAGGYVEKYGPDERYNFLKYVERVSVPTLCTFGSAELETNMAFRGLPELLEPMAKGHAGFRVKVIAGADHFYSGARREVVACVVEWAKSLGS